MADEFNVQMEVTANTEPAVKGIKEAVAGLVNGVFPEINTSLANQLTSSLTRVAKDIASTGQDFKKVFGKLDSEIQAISASTGTWETKITQIFSLTTALEAKFKNTLAQMNRDLLGTTDSQIQAQLTKIKNLQKTAAYGVAKGKIAPENAASIQELATSAAVPNGALSKVEYLDSLKSSYSKLTNLITEYTRVNSLASDAEKQAAKIAQQTASEKLTTIKAVDAENAAIEKLYRTIDQLNRSVSRASTTTGNKMLSLDTSSPEYSTLTHIREQIKSLRANLDSGVPDVNRFKNELANLVEQFNVVIRTAPKTAKEIKDTFNYASIIAQIEKVTQSLEALTIKTGRNKSQIRDSLLTKDYGSFGNVNSSLDTAKSLIKQAQSQDLTKLSAQELSSTLNALKEAQTNLAHTSRLAVNEMKPLSGSMEWAAAMAKRAVEYVAVYGGIFAVIGVMKQLATVEIEVESQTALLSAILGQTKAEAYGLEVQIQKTATALGTSYKEANQAAVIFARAGIKPSDIANEVGIATKLAGLTGDTLEQSSRAMIAFKENFKNIGMEAVGEKLGWLANSTKFATQDINTLGNYALATWVNLGGGIDTLNGMAAAFAKAGLSASTTGTTIARFGSLMMENKKVTLDFFDALNINQDKFRKAFAKNDVAALEEFINRLKSLNQDKFDELLKPMGILEKKTLEEVRTNGSTIVSMTIDSVTKSKGSLDEYNKVLDTTAKQWQILLNNLIDLGTTVGTPLLEVAASGIKAVNNFSDVIRESFKTMKESSAFSWLQENWAEIKIILVSLSTFAGLFVVSLAGPTVLTGLVALKTLIGELKIAMLELNVVTSKNAFLTVASVIMGVGSYVGDKLHQETQDAYEAAQKKNDEEFKQFLKDRDKTNPVPNTSGTDKAKKDREALKSSFDGKNPREGKGPSAESFDAYFNKILNSALGGSGGSGSGSLGYGFFSAETSYNKLISEIDAKYKANGKFQDHAKESQYNELLKLATAKKKLDIEAANDKFNKAINAIKDSIDLASGATSQYEINVRKLKETEADSLKPLNERLEILEKMKVKGKDATAARDAEIKALELEKSKVVALTAEKKKELDLLEKLRKQKLQDAVDEAKAKIPLTNSEKLKYTNTPVSYGRVGAEATENAAYQDKVDALQRKLATNLTAEERDAVSNNLKIIEQEHLATLLRIEKEYNTGYNVIKDAWAGFNDSLANQLTDVFKGKFTNLGDFLTNLMNNVSSAIANSMAKNIAASLTSIAQDAMRTFGPSILGAIGFGSVGGASTTSLPTDSIMGTGASLAVAWTGGRMGFASGGYTGDGGKYQPAGVVHKGEYVIPQHLVKKLPNTIASLENLRNRGYSEGGMVGAEAVPNSKFNPKNIKVEIKNESGQAVSAKSSSVNMDMDTLVIGIVLNAMTTNKGGLRTAMKGY